MIGPFAFKAILQFLALCKSEDCSEKENATGLKKIHVSYINLLVVELRLVSGVRYLRQNGRNARF
jgi:hypothetical protein